METVGDVALEFCYLYQKMMERMEREGPFKKDYKQEMFKSIIDYLFEKYAFSLGYTFSEEGKSLFKSDIILAKNARKKIRNKNKDKKFILEPYDDEELHSLMSSSRYSEKNGEGSGESFVLNQINELGLNPDSY